MRLFGGKEIKMLSGNGSITTKHNDLTLGIDGLILKITDKGEIVRFVAPEFGRHHAIAETLPEAA